MRSEVTFRAAGEADLAAIIALLADDVLGATRERIATTVAPEYLAAFRALTSNPDQLIVVGTRDEQVVATLQLTFIAGLSNKGAWRGQIEGVRVSASLRGQKIGEQMIAWSLDRCRERNCHVVQLTSDMRRTDARRFYERLGFTPSHVGFKRYL